MQTPEVWGECDTYRLTPFSTRGGLVGMFMPQRLPKARSATDTRGAWVGGGPTNARFLQLFLSLVFFFFSFSHFVRCQFFVCGCRCRHLIFKNKSRLVLFSADTGTRGGGEADTNMRQAGRAPKGGRAPNTNSVR